MIGSLHAFAEDAGPAGRLAAELKIPLRLIAHHRFPDGESLPRVGEASGPTGLYRALHAPDEKLMPLLLAADALRRRGASRLVLVAPYMPYLRQDAVFAEGQPLSRDVLGRLLGEAFEAILTVQPHLHRTPELGPVFAGAHVVSLSAAQALAAALGPAASGAVVVGPDRESEPWVRELAGLLGTHSLVFDKIRRGDREVSLELAGTVEIAGRDALLFDDICASGGTLEAAARQLRALGARNVDVAVVHALFGPDTPARLRAAGVRRLIATDSCNPDLAPDHELAPLADLLGRALKGFQP